MSQRQCKYFCIAVYLLCLVQNGFGQLVNQPDIACPDLFKYVCFNNNCFGKITLPNISYGQTRIEAEFSQLLPVTSGYYGSINNIDDSDTVLNKIARQEPVAFRVEFPLRNELPKLTKIAVNGFVLCSASEYADARTRLKLSIDNYSNIIYTGAVGNSNFNEQLEFFPFGGNVQLDNEYGFNTATNRGLPSRRTQAKMPWLPDSSSLPAIGTQLGNTNIFNKSPNQGLPSRHDLPKVLVNSQTPRRQITPSNPLPQIGVLVPAPKQQPEVSFRNYPIQNAESSKTEPTTLVRDLFQSFKQQDIATICGLENDKPALVPFITGGIVLHRGQFPWLTAIYHRTVLGTSFICGGSLISMRTVLTAAHCFVLTQLQADSLAVSLGRHDISKTNEIGAEARDIKTLITHNEYDPGSFPDADIALLIMAESVSFTDVIKPICLWTTAEDDLINETGFIAGWGGDSYGNPISPVPKMAPATIVSESVCRKSSDLLKKFSTSRTFCAGEQNGIGPCMGDSGGGLMIKRNDRWILRGVVSAGTTEHSRCNLRQYVIYCDVAKHISWVMSNML